MHTPAHDAVSPEAARRPAEGRLRAKLRELFGVDLRSLALLRIGLGLAVLIDAAMRALDLEGLYSDLGVLPRDLLLASEGRGVYLSVHYWASQHVGLQALVFALTGASAIALAAGWRTRLATLACWYLVASVQVRQPLGYMGGDSILRLLLFWGLFLPLGARFSIDAARRKPQETSDWFVSGATVALLVQVCLIYWATGIRKDGPLWATGQAVFYALHSEAWPTSFGVWLRDYPALLEPLTHASLALELFGPFLAFVPVFNAFWRIVTVAMFWSFHLGLAAAMNIGLFPLFSMVAWLPFLPTAFWTRLGYGARAATPRPATRRSRLASTAAAVVLVYVVVLLAERARIIPRVVPSSLAQVGTALRIQQTWNMFAPDPPTATARFEVQRTLSDGSQVVERATSSFRWTVYIGRVGGTFPPGHPFARSLQRFAERECAWRPAESSADRTVDRVAVLVYQREISRDGLSDGQERTLIDVPCVRR